MNPIRVVLIDDNHTVLLITRWLLEDDGRFALVAAVGNPVTALAWCRDADLVVLDIEMPGIDGLSVLSDIRDRHPQLPVVMLSAYDAPYLRGEAFRRGATDCLNKTTDLVNIVDRLAAAAEPRPGTPHHSTRTSTSSRPATTPI